jgi:hypothetical protein
VANTTLVQRAHDKVALYQLLEETGGELNETLEKWLAEIETGLVEKVDGYEFFLSEVAADRDRLKDQAKQYREAADSLDRLLERAKDRIKFTMRHLGVDELRGTLHRFKLSKAAPRLVIVDAELPASYTTVVTTVEADKDRIKEDLAKGVAIPGVTQVEGFALRTYVNKESVKK